MALTHPNMRIGGIHQPLVKRRRRRIYKAEGRRSRAPLRPTICGALITRVSSCSPTAATAIFIVFERAFKDFGLPQAIRTDNGSPFASANSPFGLTRLSVWWLRLGIDDERIKPGHPQQNGRDERMHLTLRQEASKPASRNFLQQQARFNQFITTFNHERPHEALNMRYPAELYSRSPRLYEGLPELEYPFHDRTITVTQPQPGLRRPEVGVKQVEEKIWRVSFMRF